MLKFWFREEVARAVVERYADWRSLTDSEAFLKHSTTVQLDTASIWISATVIGEPFGVPGSNGWKALEILINSNAPSGPLKKLFEDLGGFYQGEVEVR